MQTRFKTKYGNDYNKYLNKILVEILFLNADKKSNIITYVPRLSLTCVHTGVLDTHTHFLPIHTRLMRGAPFSSRRRRHSFITTTILRYISTFISSAWTLLIAHFGPHYIHYVAIILCLLLNIYL